MKHNEEEVREVKIWPYDVGFDPGEAKRARINKERLDKAPPDAQDLIILEPQETWAVDGLPSCCDTASIDEEITVVGYALGPYRIGTLTNHRVIPAPYGHIRAASYHRERVKTTHQLTDLMETRHHYLEAREIDKAAEVAFVVENILRTWGQYKEAERINN